MMRKRRSLIVSLTLALLLVLSAPFALVFNKDKTTKAEITGAIDGTALFEYTKTGSGSQYYAPKIATTAIK